MARATGRVCRRHLTVRLLAPVALALALGQVPGAGPFGLAVARAEQPGAPNTMTALRARMAGRASADLRGFYAARGWRPLWLDETSRPRPALVTLLRQLEDARIDGIKPSRVKASDLRKAIDRADGGDLDDLARLELTASRAYASWVKALRAAPRAKMQYESEVLAPVVPTTSAALQALAAAPSAERFVAAMGWMHPLYAPLRAALASPGYSDRQRRQIALNLDRVRAIPANPASRYVLVDAAGARLWMYEGGEVVDTMKVVVGKPDNQTPMMAGFIRNAILNPYWNVPDDLVRQRIAWNVQDKGLGYLKAGGYQVLADWTDTTPMNPALVDWRAVEQGLARVHVRQLPGGSNFMGRVKFEFPNPQGIYLHDTPEKNLMRQDERTASSGCVRLEDASRLGRWLMGKPLPRKVAKPEKRVNLPHPVPVYLTYLTVFPEKTGTLAFRSDPYGRDGDDTLLAAR